MSLAASTQLLLSNYSTAVLDDLYRHNQQYQFKVRGICFDKRNKVEEFGSLLLPRESGIISGVLEITLDDGALIHCSNDQVFLSTDGEYIDARNLDPRMELLGKGTLTGEHTYVIDRIVNKGIHTKMMSITSVRYRNYALGCGVFTRS